MDNQLICNNCKESNPVFALNCNKCNSFLRARVPNIDLWDAIWNILVTPVNTAIKLIQAEKKNFIVFLLFIWFIKATINHFIISNYFQVDFHSSITDSLLYGGMFSVILIILFSAAVTASFNALKIPTRLKDILTIYTYSLVPILIAFSFLTPFHFAFYGFYWYTINPSPLIIKPFVTYVLYGIEGLFYCWVLFLFIATTFAQSGKLILSFFVGLILFLFLMGYIFLIV